MTALVEALLAIVGLFIVFVQTYLIPATAADLNLIHIAIWLPVVVGLASVVIGMLKGMWSRRGRRA